MVEAMTATMAHCDGRKPKEQPVHGRLVSRWKERAKGNGAGASPRSVAASHPVRI